MIASLFYKVIQWVITTDVMWEWKKQNNWKVIQFLVMDEKGSPCHDLDEKIVQSFATTVRDVLKNKKPIVILLDNHVYTVHPPVPARIK